MYVHIYIYIYISIYLVISFFFYLYFKSICLLVERHYRPPVHHGVIFAGFIIHRSYSWLHPCKTLIHSSCDFCYSNSTCIFPLCRCGKSNRRFARQYLIDILFKAGFGIFASCHGIRAAEVQALPGGGQKVHPDDPFLDSGFLGPASRPRRSAAPTPFLLDSWTTWYPLVWILGLLDLWRWSPPRCDLPPSCIRPRPARQMFNAQTITSMTLLQESVEKLSAQPY